MTQFIPLGARVVCLSPHPDDAEFGAGGLLHRRRADIEAWIICFSDRLVTRGERHNDRDQISAAAALGVPSERVRFVDQLDIGVDRLPIRLMDAPLQRDRIRRIVTHVTQTLKPDLLLIPALEETMQDHQAIAEETIRITRAGPTLLGYETPKHSRSFNGEVFFQLDEEDIAAKCQSLAAYSEASDRYHFERPAIEAMARFRGLQAGIAGYAEAFRLYYQLSV